jgi:hypothetical protein
VLRKQKPAFGFGNGPPEFACGFQPLGDHDLDVGKRFLPGSAIARAAR